MDWWSTIKKIKIWKEDRKWYGKETVILTIVLNECFTYVKTVEQRSEGGEGQSPEIIWEKNISSKGNERCKGPEVQNLLTHLKSTGDFSVTGMD